MAKGSVNVPGVPMRDLSAHMNNHENPHVVTKKQVGLENVDNTSDNDKPVSTAQKQAIDAAKQEGTEAKNQLAAHNKDQTAHNDIREFIIELNNRLNAVADSDDVTLDQLSEIVTYIKSNKSLIDSITTSKVSVDAIVDNLTTANSKKVLSANQGVALKALIDALSSGKADNGHSHNASDIDDGTLNSERLPTVTVPKGGTGKTSVTAGNFLVGNGTGAMTEKTPAAVRTLIGAAPAGYGYGGAIDSVFSFTSDSDLKSTLNELLSVMPDGSSRIVRFTHEGNVSHSFSGVGYLFGYLHKNTNNNVILQAYSYSTTAPAFRLTKTDGTWGEIEWENPPLNVGVEYRTTERYLGNPVYMKVLDFGTLPNTTYKTVAHNIASIVTCIDATPIGSNNRIALTGHSYMSYLNFGPVNVELSTKSNASSVSAYILLRYTK